MGRPPQQAAYPGIPTIVSNFTRPFCHPLDYCDTLPLLTVAAR